MPIMIFRPVSNFDDQSLHQTPYPKAKYSISIVSDKKVETNYALPKYLIELLIPNPKKNYLYMYSFLFLTNRL
jgi:hypothetical protein